MSDPREIIASAANLSRREVDAILQALADSGWEIVRLERHCLIHENAIDCPGGGPCL